MAPQISNGVPDLGGRRIPIRELRVLPAFSLDVQAGSWPGTRGGTYLQLVDMLTRTVYVLPLELVNMNRLWVELGRRIDQETGDGLAANGGGVIPVQRGDGQGAPPDDAGGRREAGR